MAKTNSPYRVEITAYDVYNDQTINKSIKRGSHFTFKDWYLATNFIEVSQRMLGFASAEKFEVKQNEN